MSVRDEQDTVAAMQEPPAATAPAAPSPRSPRLSIYRWRLAMIASIAHRGSGLILVLFVPLYLWLLQGMTGSVAGFDAALNWLHSGLGRLSLWLVGTALAFHLCNGIRFLLLDFGVGEARRTMRGSAKLVLVVTALVALLLAVVL